MTYTALFLLILVIHFVADFPLQTHDQAIGKGEGKSFFNKMLFYHVGMYTLIWSIIYWILPLPLYLHHPVPWIIFCLLIFIPHYCTDYITSRINKGFFGKQDFHNGFVGVGFDQMIHYICLWLVLTMILGM